MAQMGDSQSAGAGFDRLPRCAFLMACSSLGSEKERVGAGTAPRVSAARVLTCRCHWWQNLATASRREGVLPYMIHCLCPVVFPEPERFLL